MPVQGNCCWLEVFADRGQIYPGEIEVVSVAGSVANGEVVSLRPLSCLVWSWRG